MSQAQQEESAVYIKELIESEAFQDIHTQFEGRLHPKLIAFSTKRARHVARERSEGLHCDSVEELWEALPDFGGINYIALTGEPDGEGVKSIHLNFAAIAFIRDPRREGWHVLMLDQYILARPDIDALTDITDRAPSDYMSHHFGAITQMLMGTRRRERHPILSIRYGDGGIGKYRNPEELYHNLEERGIIERSGLEAAMTWLSVIIDYQSLPMQSTDARTEGMQIISPAAISHGYRLWKTHPEDIFTVWDDEYESEEDSGAEATSEELE